MEGTWNIPTLLEHIRWTETIGEKWSVSYPGLFVIQPLLVVEIIDGQPLWSIPLAWVKKELQMQLGQYSGWLPSRFHISDSHFAEPWVFPWSQISHMWFMVIISFGFLYCVSYANIEPEILIIECIKEPCRSFPIWRLFARTIHHGHMTLLISPQLFQTG